MVEPEKYFIHIFLSSSETFVSEFKEIMKELFFETTV